MKFSGKSTFFPEIVHACLLLAPWTTVFYTFFENRRDELIVPLFFMSFFLFLPMVLILKVSALKAKTLWGYLGAVIVCTPLFVIYYKAVSHAAPVGILSVTATIENIICFIILAADNYMIRVTANRKRRALLENDRSFIREDRITQTPGVAMPVIYLVIYCQGLLFESPRTSDIGLWGGIACLLVLLVFGFIRSNNGFFNENRELKRVPVLRIRRMGTMFLSAIIAIILILCLIPLFTSNLRRYTNIRNWEAPHTEQQKEIETETLPRQEAINSMMPPDLEELVEYEPNPIMDAIYEILTVLLVIVAVAALALVISAGIIGLFKHFKDTPAENGDVIMAIDPEDESSFFKRNRRGSTHDRSTEKERIRRKYRDMIRKAKKEKPTVSLTPTEIEAFAGLSEDSEMKAFHSVYEGARYGK